MGPNNAGKSVLLDKLVRLWRANSYLEEHRPIFHLDFKSMELRTPEGATKALRGNLAVWIARLKSLTSASLGIKLQVLGTMVNLSSLGQLMAKKLPEFPFETLISCIDKMGKIKKVKPLWVIDEFQKLREWGSKQEMDFFKQLIKVTKQEEAATVFLSTSDDQFELMFQNITSTGIHAMHFWDTIGVGFFKEEDAKAFMMSRLDRSFKLADDLWVKTSEVCGGCAMHLSDVASALRHNDRDAVPVLEKLTSQGMLIVQQGFGDSRWNSDRYKQIMELIVNSEDGSVLSGTIRKKVYGGDLDICKAELRALVAANVFHYRYAPKHVWYSDLAPTNSKGLGRIMARSPPHKHAMRLFLGDPDEYF